MLNVRLKSERTRLGLTQPEFAEAAGAKKRTLIDWEKGVSSPTAMQLSALAEIGVDVLFVLTGLRTETHKALNAIQTSTEAAESFKYQTGDKAKADVAVVQENIFNQYHKKELTKEEEALLDNYRNSPPEGQAAIRSTSAAFAQQKNEKDVSGEN